MKKAFQRKCMACNTKNDKYNLIRIVRLQNDEILMDKTGKQNGRGAYICKDIKCLEKVIKTNRIDKILGKKIDKKIYEDIKKYDGVLGIHDLVIHSYGPSKTFVTAHVEVDSKIDIMLSHDMIDNIESDFKKEFNIDLVIHLDPIDIHDEETQKLRSEIHDILMNIDPKLTFHDFRVVKGVTHTNVLFDVVMPITYPKTPQELKVEIANRIKEHNNFLNPVIVIDHFYDRNN